jgi:regulator of replication initiation timing
MFNKKLKEENRVLREENKTLRQELNTKANEIFVLRHDIKEISKKLPKKDGKGRFCKK